MPRSMYNHADKQEDKEKSYIELDSTETEIIKYLNDNYKDVILLVKSSAAMELDWLKQYPNIVFHGLVPQPELPAYLAQMDVCLNVFRAGALSKDVSPLKFYEYLATGKPIVSTREPLQVEDFKDVVYIARNPEMFLPLCDAAAKENRPAWTEKRLAYGAQCSWTERVHQMEEVLYKKGVLHESAEE